MKAVNQVTGKGILEISFDEGKATITEITKDDEIVYDFFEILEKFNDRTVSFRIAEEQLVEPIDGE